MVDENFQEKFPFLSGIQFGEDEFIGIVQNSDGQTLSFYDLNKLASATERKKLISLGELWWWESNRQIPIDVFLFHEMKEFRHCLTTVTYKDARITFGPITSLQDILKKRIKRRSIQLVRKID